MAQNTGTLVIAPIRPFDSSDTYASAYANDIKGGVHVVDKLSGSTSGYTYLYDITNDRRQEGMLGVTTTTMKTYQLSGGTDNSDWVEFSGGGGVEYLSELQDVSVSGLSEGQALIYTGGTWVNENLDVLYATGGLKNVPNIPSRNAIPRSLRREGMIVGVLDTASYWRLNAPPWVGNNSDWSLFSVSAVTSLKLEELGDVYLTGTTNGDILVYSGGTWVNLKYEMISSGKTTLYNNSTTNFVIGDVNLDRGIFIDYTLSRSSVTNNIFQMGNITILNDDISTYINNVYQNTSSSNEEFTSFNSFINSDDILLSCSVNDNIYDVIIAYHIRKIKKVDF